MSGNNPTIKGGIGTISRLASRVAERVSIRDIRLMETSAELKNFSTDGPLSWDLGISSSAHYKPGDSYFVLMIGYQVTIEKPEDSAVEEADKSSDEVAEISFQFGVLCELELQESSSEITKEEVEEYGDATAKIILSPYVREYIHDVTMRMGLPPLIMDILPSFTEEPSRAEH
jgi:hypothetical protein